MNLDFCQKNKLVLFGIAALLAVILIVFASDLGLQEDKKIGDDKQLEYLDYHYTKDKNGAYYYSKLVEDADPETFEVISAYYAKDADRVYCASGISASVKNIDSADSKTFETIDTEHSRYPGYSHYARDNEEVYYCDGMGSEAKVLDKADPFSFEKAFSDYYKSNNLVYFEGELIPGLSGDDMEFFGSYVFSKGEIYASGKNIKADIDTFQVLFQGYAKDKNKVYSVHCGSECLKDKDPTTFEVYDNYTKDKNGVYFNIIGYDSILEGADPTTFKEIGGSIYQSTGASYYTEMTYYGDKNSVYFEFSKLEGASPDSFEILGSGYSKDAGTIFYEYKKIADADPTSFEVLGARHARDKNTAYYGVDKIEGSDSDSFEVTDEYRAKDKNHTYMRKNKE